jgi:MoaA/NifB/PqqE/SkfB family radical SAM enzyme
MSSVLQDTSLSIETAMKELYDLQTAIINANGDNSPASSRKFTDIRRSLKGQWEAIVKLLKNIHSFGDDIALLRANVNEADYGDLCEVLEEVISKGIECAKDSQSLINGHDAVMEHYRTHQEEFSHELEHPKYHIEPRFMPRRPAPNLYRADKSANKRYKPNCE